MQKKYNGFKKLKIKIIKKEKRKKKEEERKKGKGVWGEGGEENATELQKPNVEQRFITTIKSVTEYTHIHVHS